MPLIKGKSKKAFSENVKAEMKSGKPQPQALAIAYSVKRKAAHKKMAQGGEVPEKTEIMHEEMRHVPTPLPIEHDERDQMPKGKIQLIKRPKMTPSSVIKTREADESMYAEGGAISNQANLKEDEKHLQKSASVNNGPQIQPREDRNEIGPKRIGPDVPALHMKKMAKGGEVAQETVVIPDKGFGKIIRVGMAEGGEVSPEEEIQDEAENSIAAAIMSKRRKMANGGVVDHADPQHEDDSSLEEGQVDIDDNARELPNAYYGRNEDKVLKENYDEDIINMSQPEDSNEHGDILSDADAHDMVDSIRRKMKSRRQMPQE